MSRSASAKTSKAYTFESQHFLNIKHKQVCS